MILCFIRMAALTRYPLLVQKRGSVGHMETIDPVSHPVRPLLLSDLNRHLSVKASCTIFCNSTATYPRDKTL